MNDSDQNRGQGTVVMLSRGPAGQSELTPLVIEETKQGGRIASVPTVVSFDKKELHVILNLYRRKVAEGEWRDYAIDFTPSVAVFSIFRRTSEVPLFRIEKEPKLANKKGAYSVVAAGGLVLKQGQDIMRVIEILDRRSKLTLV